MMVLLTRMTGVLLMVAALTIPALARADLATDLKVVVVENMEATQAEDMARMMATIHHQSPSYRVTQQQVAPLFQQFDLTYQLLGYEYVGLTGEFAVVKVRQSVRKLAGDQPFRNNEMELLQAFKKENGQWKFWNQAILSIRFLP